MKKLLISALLFFTCILAKAQNIGIGVIAPTERFQVDSGHIKVGSGVLSAGGKNLVKFGDGDYVHIGEVGDDTLELKGKQFRFVNAYGAAYTEMQLNGYLKMIDG